eukprot:gene10287-2433_t
MNERRYIYLRRNKPELFDETGAFRSTDSSYVNNLLPAGYRPPCENLDQAYRCQYQTSHATKHRLNQASQIIFSDSESADWLNHWKQVVDFDSYLCKDIVRKLNESMRAFGYSIFNPSPLEDLVHS